VSKEAAAFKTFIIKMKSVFIHHTGSKTYIALTGTFSMNVGEPIAPLNPVG